MEERITRKIKKKKLVQMVRAYKNVKFSFLAKRLQEHANDIEKMVFELIVDGEINGRIHEKEKFLEVTEPENVYLTSQLANIKELASRY